LFNDGTATFDKGGTMRIRTLIVAVTSLVFFMSFALSALAQEMKPIQLPEPKLDQNKSLAQALNDRKSAREFRDESLPVQTLSNLLCAAFGINRPDSGRRTAPSAKNWQEIDIYVSTANGVYLYDPKANTLVPVAPWDIRALTGTQAFVKDAGVNLVYVADLAKMGEVEGLDKMNLAAADTGFIAQNVYLYCASEGLTSVFRAMVNRQNLARAMKLRSDQVITYCQTVGYPKGK
jgi:nitroreductase